MLTHKNAMLQKEQDVLKRHLVNLLLTYGYVALEQAIKAELNLVPKPKRAPKAQKVG